MSPAPILQATNSKPCGTTHWHQFKRIRVMTESAWLRAATIMFGPFFPGQIQLFKLAELDPAKTWITRKGRAGA